MNFVQPALAAYATATQRKFSDRARTVGASEIGQCMRRVWYAKNGAPAANGNADWGPATRGSVFESAFWEPALREQFNVRLLYAGSDQRTFAQGELSATPDALLVLLTEAEAQVLGVQPLGSVILECKTIDPRSHISEPLPQHVMQAQAQLGLLREQTNHKPSHAIISYVDSSSWSKVTEFVVEFDPAIFAVCKQRARKIMTAVEAAELQPEGYIAGGRECEYCPFARPCGRARTTVPTTNNDIDPVAVAEVSALGREIIHLDELAEKAATAVRERKEAMRNRLRELNTRHVDGNGVVILWSQVKGRTTVDVDAMRASGIDVSQFEKTGAQSDRLTVKLKPPII